MSAWLVLKDRGFCARVLAKTAFRSPLRYLPAGRLLATSHRQHAARGLPFPLPRIGLWRSRQLNAAGGEVQARPCTSSVYSSREGGGLRQSQFLSCRVGRLTNTLR